MALAPRGNQALRSWDDQPTLDHYAECPFGIRFTSLAHPSSRFPSPSPPQLLHCSGHLRACLAGRESALTAYVWAASACARGNYETINSPGATSTPSPCCSRPWSGAASPLLGREEQAIALAAGNNGGTPTVTCRGATCPSPKSADPQNSRLLQNNLSTGIHRSQLA